MKVIMVDVPRPRRDLVIPDVRPGDDPEKILDSIEKEQSNGNKPQE